LHDLAGCNSYEAFIKNHRDWVTEALNSGKNIRDSKWTQSIAVGSEKFIDNIKEDLVISAKGRKVSGTKDIFQLRETSAP
jgi:putative transposase